MFQSKDSPKIGQKRLGHVKISQISMGLKAEIIMKLARPLPPRQREVLQLLTIGYSRKAIALMQSKTRNGVDHDIKRLEERFGDDPRINNHLIDLDTALRLIGEEYFNEEGHGENTETNTIEDNSVSLLIQKCTLDLQRIRSFRRTTPRNQPINAEETLIVDAIIRDRIKTVSQIANKRSLILFRGEILFELQWAYKAILWYDELPGDTPKIIKEMQLIADACQDNELYLKSLLADGHLQYALRNYDEAILKITQAIDNAQNINLKLHILQFLKYIYDALMLDLWGKEEGVYFRNTPYNRDTLLSMIQQVSIYESKFSLSNDLKDKLQEYMAQLDTIDIEIEKLIKKERDEDERTTYTSLDEHYSIEDLERTNAMRCSYIKSDDT